MEITNFGIGIIVAAITVIGFLSGAAAKRRNAA